MKKLLVLRSGGFKFPDDESQIDKTFFNWIWRNTRNESIDEWRRQRRMVPESHLAEEGEDELPALERLAHKVLANELFPQEAAAFRRQEWDIQEKCIRALKPEWEEIIRTYRFPDKDGNMPSIRACADLLGISEETVTMRDHHARKALRKCLEKHGVPSGGTGGKKAAESTNRRRKGANI